MRRALCVGVAALLVAPLALADDLNPPPNWNRGDPGSTYQSWEFDTDLSPTFVDNDYGTPTTSSYYGDEEWMDTYEGRDGLMYFPWYDELYFHIPNRDQANPRKEVWFQITYFAFSGFPSLEYAIDGWGGESTGFAGPGVDLTVLESTAAGDWVYEAFHWYIEPNPAGERITLTSAFDDIYIDQIHIDTICIPEPGTLILLSLGGLLAIRRRR